MTGKAPTAWLLLGTRVGDNSQARALVRLLKLEHEEKDIRFNRLYQVPNPLKGASLVTLDQGRSSPLKPPWPDLVIAVGRRSVPIVRWIRKQADHPVCLIQIGRPQAAPEHFDLILTSPQYRLVPHRNIVELPLPLTLMSVEDLERAGAQWRSSVEDLPRPLIAIIIGGNTSTCRFEPEDARILAQRAGEYAAARGGSLIVSTSARTSPEALAALKAALPASARVHEWNSTGENPYRGYLALADEIVVTDDSASMIADAGFTGKPLWLYPVPFRTTNPIIRLQDRLEAHYLGERASGSRAVAVLVEKLFRHGWLSAPRRMDRLVGTLVAANKARVFSHDALVGEPPPAREQSAQPGASEAVERIKALLAL